MILADTSVIVDCLRGKDLKLQALIPLLPVAVCGVTRAEVLCGSRDAAHRQKLLAILAALQAVPIPEAIWTEVGDNWATLRVGGVTVPFQDLLIASVAIVNAIELWTRDIHFGHIQRILPALHLYREPP